MKNPYTTPSRVNIDVLLAYAENDMLMTKTAEAIYRSVYTVNWHLEQIHKLTGLNPKKFYDLVKLVDIYGKEEYR